MPTDGDGVMPINCPVYNLVCDEVCRYLNEDRCGWFADNLPLSEILTPEERLDRIEVMLKEKVKPSKQREEVQQLKAMVRYLQDKQNEIIQAVGLKRDDDGKLGRSTFKDKYI